VAVLSIAAPTTTAAQSVLFAKRELIAETGRVLDAQWRGLSDGRKSLAYLKRVTPFYTWINLCNVVKVDATIVLLGHCIEEQVKAFLRLPLERFRVEYPNALSRLWSQNELDAIKFSNAVEGYSSSDEVGDNFLSFLQIIGALLLLIWLLSRMRLSFAGWAKLKWFFYGSLAVWLIGGALIQILLARGGDFVTLLNLHNIAVTGFGSLSIILGLILFGRWLWLKNNSARPNA
jgi:hypothetical protein